MGQGAGAVTLAGVSACQPMTQGDLVALCGLYAAINAIRVVLAPVSPLGGRQTRRLMNRGVAQLQEQGLLHEAMVEGMEGEVQHELVRVLAGEAGAITGIPLMVTQPALTAKRFGRQQMLRIIDEGLEQGAAAMIGLEGPVSHYSVIVGYDDRRYMLLDSHGMTWIARNSVGAPRSKRRYQIERAGLVLLRRQLVCV